MLKKHPRCRDAVTPSPKRNKGQPLTQDDPLWSIVGTGSLVEAMQALTSTRTWPTSTSLTPLTLPIAASARRVFDDRSAFFPLIDAMAVIRTKQAVLTAPLRRYCLGTVERWTVFGQSGYRRSRGYP